MFFRKHLYLFFKHQLTDNRMDHDDQRQTDLKFTLHMFMCSERANVQRDSGALTTHSFCSNWTRTVNGFHFSCFCPTSNSLLSRKVKYTPKPTHRKLASSHSPLCKLQSLYLKHPFFSHYKNVFPFLYQTQTKF